MKNVRRQFRLPCLGSYRRCLALAVAGLLLAFRGAAQVATPLPQPQAAQERPGATTLTELRHRIGTLISDRKFASAQWGVKIVESESGTVVFEHNAGQLFSPASNSKLYTVALGLDRLGVDYRIRTSLYASARPNPDGVLEGDLIVYGRGDPTINGRLNGGDLLRAMRPLVSALTNAGVRQVNGNLIGDTSFIRGPEFGSGWSWDDQFYYYGAEISALTVNDNLVSCTVLPGAAEGAPCEVAFDPPTRLTTVHNRSRTVARDGARSIRLIRLPSRNELYITGELPREGIPFRAEVTVHDPAALFLELFASALAAQGVSLAGTNRVVSWLDEDRRAVGSLVELGYVESLPLRDIAREIQKPSQNLYTDLLLAHVGERSRTEETPPDLTSEELGIRELTRFLGAAGVPPGHVLFEEGSGLSRNNLTTPAATIALLRHMNEHKAADAYLQSLPVAGVDGTLRNRMNGTAAAGKVRAKTGTLRWANSLSGYVTTASGEKLLFALMLNRFHGAGGSRSARAELDAIAIELAAFSGRVR